MATTTTASTTRPTRDLREELERRMRQPQRHRLLHGYPMLPVMPAALPGTDPFAGLGVDPARPLIVGVLPHASCNPKVRGCGFCTFPHDTFEGAAVRRVVAQVRREIANAAPAFGARRVDAVYLGGGTANLTPPDELAQLCATLAQTFDLAGAELTLEGVPRYFLIRAEAALDVVSNARVAHRRISMGVQSFDPAWLARMGRDAFGDRDDIARVVAAAHRRGFTASADLLFNLPGATQGDALADVRTAIAIGFDQICVYNLVLTEDLGTAWSHDRSLLAARPDRATALGTWRALRELLLASDYVQTTLTNFERRAGRRFAYERASFAPGTYDGLGFGPGAISTVTARGHATARKWVNAPTGDAYVAAMPTPAARIFDYAPIDLRLLHLTRNLAALRIDHARYERCFSSPPYVDFIEELLELERAGLLDASGALTIDGMFYADAVAGLLAHRRIARLRGLPDDHAGRMSAMG